MTFLPFWLEYSPMEILRNILRRKFRSALTIFGIAIGIFAFTVMGSLALKLNRMIDGGKKYITGQITIMPKGTGAEAMGGGGGSILPVDTLNKISNVEGVDKVGAMVSLLLEEPDPDNPSSGGMTMSPPTIYGSDFKSEFKNKNWESMAMKEGHMVGKDDSNDKVSVGISVATDKKLKVGDKMTIRGQEFEVAGIVDRTMTGPDSYVFMSIDKARDMLIESNPFLKSLKQRSEDAAKISDAALASMPPETRKQITEAKSFNVEDITSMAGVTWKDGYDSEVLADKIKNEFKKEVSVLSPKKMGEQIDQGSAIINAVILGSAVIALVVGGFSIINTMVMSISERTKEIGIKKALGASNKSILFEYTTEAGIIGLIGGAIGTGLGLIAMISLNSKMASKGAEIFLIDTNYVVYVLAFSFVLGILAGIIPAYRASKLKVVDALREL